jgi:hypothetical protein
MGDYKLLEVLNDDMPRNQSATDSLKTLQKARERFYKTLALGNCTVRLYRYRRGGNHQDVAYVWKIPNDTQPDGAQEAAILAQVQTNVRCWLSRTMVQDFQIKISNLVNLKPITVRAILQEVGHYDFDQGKSNEKALLERAVEYMSLANSPELLEDLINSEQDRSDGRSKFEPFWSAMRAVVNRDINAGAQERRHDQRAFASDFVSINDLIKRTKKYMQDAGAGASEPLIPSAEFVRIQFSPSKPFAAAQANFTSMIPLVRKIQTRTLRQKHEDTHYVSAQWCIIREWVVHLRSQCEEFDCQIRVASTDDKSKVPVGEPGRRVASGVRPRGHGRIVSTGDSQADLAAMDHDQYKANATPSVSLFIDVPIMSAESFYAGQLFVAVKDSVFQPSTPVMHAVELARNLLTVSRCGLSDDVPLVQQLKVASNNLSLPEVFVLKTDGGADHNVKHARVQLSAIMFFMACDLDVYVSMRTAPHQSFLNEVERAMSLLNIALEHVSLERTPLASADLEQIVRGLNSMKSIREKAQKHPDIKAEWKQAMEGPFEVMTSRFQKLELTGKQVKTSAPAGEEEMASFHALLTKIDPNYTAKCTTKKDLKSMPNLVSWMRCHCRCTTYTFTIRKCDDPTCCTWRANAALKSALHKNDPPLPMYADANHHHYKHYNDLAGQATTEADMPTYTKSSVEATTAAHHDALDRAMKKNSQVSSISR